MLARNIDISKWNHICSSYILQRIHMYQNGLNVYHYNFIDEKEDPLPSNTFKKVSIGKNMRGLYTDLNIYSSYFDDKEMISWTTGCDHTGGEIFTWDKTKLNITNNENTPNNVTIIQIEKSEVCPNINQLVGNTLVKKQELKKSSGKADRTRFQPRFSPKSPFVGSVVEVIADLKYKTTTDAQESCFRLNGELMTIPQTKEENQLTDKTL